MTGVCVPEQAGFNSGNSTHFFSIPGSQTPDIVNIESTSNVNEPGRWVFRTDTFSVLGGCVHNGKFIREDDRFWIDESCQTKCKCTSERSLECGPEACNAHEICVSSATFYTCHPVLTKTCTIFGDPHYYTFDRRVIHFQGTCTSVLSQLCDGQHNLTFYRVEGASEHRGNTAVSWLRLVRLLVYQTEILLLKGAADYILVNGTRTSIPVSLANGQLRVRASGLALSATTDFGLTVTYDGDHHASVSLPASYGGATCGMCGNMNGDPSDDLLTPDGTRAETADAFGSSWGVGGVGGCREPCSGQCGGCNETQKAAYASLGSCGLMSSQDGPFRACLAVVDPRDFVQSCVFDLCADNGQALTLCQALTSFSEVCRSFGVTPEPWRTEEFCGLRCPPHSRYELCTSACPPSCSDTTAPFYCDRPCVEGCHCDEGFVLSGASCIPLRRCGCSFQGLYYPRGSSAVLGADCGLRCTCPEAGGPMECAAHACGPLEECGLRDGVRGCFLRTAGICWSSGDHHQTFDGRSLDLQGLCRYTLSRACPPPGNLTHNLALFSVTVEIEHRGSRARMVEVEVHGHRIRISQGENGTVQVNGTAVSLPTSVATVANISQVGGDVLVVTMNQVEVRFDGQGSLFVKVGSLYANSLCGMCGNFNGDPTDDKVTPSGWTARNDSGFGNSWETANSSWRCEDDSGGTEPQCPESPEFEYLCSIILNATGPFAGCHRHLDPVNYYRSCVGDLCLHRTAGPRLCQAVRTYQKACNIEGVDIPAWHGDDNCPPPDPCGDQECTADEWCGERRGAYGCFCNPTVDLIDDHTYDYKLTCSGEKSNISFSRCLLFSDGWMTRPLHLNDPSCKGQVSHGRIVFNFDGSRRSCGSKLKVNRTHFAYSNTLHGYIVEDNGIISRNRSLSVEFSCGFPLTINLSLPLTRVVKSVVNVVLPAGSEIFEAVMIMYRDPQYSQPFTETPVTLDIGSNVYIGIHVQGIDADQFVLTLENCWTTPVRDTSSPTKWGLITNQCPNSLSEVEIKESGVSPIGRFKFPVFKFVGGVDNIYLHCQIRLCNLQTTQCSVNCSLERTNRIGGGGSQSELLSIGPITRRSSAGIVSSGNQPVSGSSLTAAILLSRLFLQHVLQL
ncbi:alpha-tectorin-like [Pristis pectinata]|uniref:alpha-tectorin-like n=1 Tax=Pristis pectinata TaxID=685728 RepID=UPI00223CE2AF|nr:alpha-tectorin-like [Pristis pectinata]